MVGAGADGLEAVALVADLDPDVVLIDLKMPRCDGVEATRQIRTRYPRTEVVVLTTYADDDSVLNALRAGARGFLTKDADARGDRAGAARGRGRSVDAGRGGAAQAGRGGDQRAGSAGRGRPNSRKG